MAAKYIYVKLIKKWSRYKVGDVIRFGYSKGQNRIKLGYGVEVPKQRAVNEPVKEAPKKEAPKVETSTKNPVSNPKTETANAAPKKDSKPSPPKKSKQSDEGQLSI